MDSERDEIQVSYFVLCDQVITEAHTNKQSLIGIYSALLTEQMPMTKNLAVGLGLRVQSSRPRGITFRFSGTDGELIFASPELPCNWDAVEEGIQAAGFASLQIGINLRAMPFSRLGVYTAALYIDGELITTYPISLMMVPQGGAI